MPTVVGRAFRSTPERNATQTWEAIVDLLTRGEHGSKRDELLTISSIVSSIIADQAPKHAAIVITCDGPRTRIYCLFDEDAIDGAGANEGVLGFDPLKGDWKISLPCTTEDLEWVQRALAQKSMRITARDMSATIAAEREVSNAADALVFDPKGFLES